MNDRPTHPVDEGLARPTWASWLVGALAMIWALTAIYLGFAPQG